MTPDQLSDDDCLVWLRSRVGDECEEFERSNAVMVQLQEMGATLMDVLHVLRHVTAISSHYDAGCFVVCGEDLDGQWLSVVVAPPSAKNRVRVVKVWRGGR